MKFEFEHLETQEEVRKQIQACESRHMQQVAMREMEDTRSRLMK